MERHKGKVQEVSEAELKQNFDLDHHFKHVDTIFERVFGKTAIESEGRPD